MDALRHCLPVLLMLGLLAVPAGADAKKKKKGPAVPTDPGLHRLTFDGTAGPVRYTVSLPEADGPRPLVLSLHYAGHGTEWYGAGLVEAVVEPGLRELASIIVGPDCLGRTWADASSEAAVAEVLDHVAATWSVDPQRTLVTGYSMGGMGTWTMVQEFPDRFAAAIPMAGRPPADVTSWTLPTYALHSRDDEFIGPGPTMQGVEKLQGLGAR
ncbi:MAG: prolyl oligopeptidase family serine peptidase [Proteobacteria bacterium]|nr:prolyl oligopeptidase family serine peptidase [Pseudomonadota bacterium]